MSEDYIKNHFSDIKNYASVIENRLDDECCTLESVLKDNRKILKKHKEYNENYILIDSEYDIKIDL